MKIVLYSICISLQITRSSGFEYFFFTVWITSSSASQRFCAFKSKKLMISKSLEEAPFTKLPVMFTLIQNIVESMKLIQGQKCLMDMVMRDYQITRDLKSMQNLFWIKCVQNNTCFDSEFVKQITFIHEESFLK